MDHQFTARKSADSYKSSMALATLLVIAIQWLGGCTKEWTSDEMMEALLTRDCDEISDVVQRGMPVDIDLDDGDGFTPLMFVAGDIDRYLVDCLLQLGADVNARDSEGWTPLMYAINPVVVEALIEAGADVNAQSNSGRTPLMSANNVEVIEILLNHGADPHKQRDDGRTVRDVRYSDEVIDFWSEYFDSESAGIPQ